MHLRECHQSKKNEAVKEVALETATSSDFKDTIPDSREDAAYVYKFMYCSAENCSSGSFSSKFFSLEIPFCIKQGGMCVQSEIEPFTQSKQ